MSKKPVETKDQRKTRLAAQFTAIRDKTGLSMDAFAKLLGYKRASSIQRYGSATDHSGQFLGGQLMERMLEKLPGTHGITIEEVRALGGPMMSGLTLISASATEEGATLRQARRQRGNTIRQVAEAVGVDVDEVDQWESGEKAPSSNQIVMLAGFLRVDASALRSGEIAPLDDEPLGDAAFISDELVAYSGPRDIEKLGVVAAGDDGDFEFNGTIAEHVARPRGLKGRPGVFALEIISESMYPAYRKTDIVFCDRAEPAIGDDVVIETFPETEGGVGKAFIKRLKKRSPKEIVVEQFNPAKELKFDAYAIKHVWRVVPNRELHGY